MANAPAGFHGFTRLAPSVLLESELILCSSDFKMLSRLLESTPAPLERAPIL